MARKPGQETQPGVNRPAQADVDRVLRTGVDHLITGRATDAATLFRRVLAADPVNVTAYVNLGLALQNQGRNDEAIANFRRALEIDPDIAQCHNNLGNALSRKGGRAEAITHYKRALLIKPDYANAHGNLGRALRQEGRLEEAAACYKRVLEFEPNSAEARVSLGLTSADGGHLEAAIEHYRQALEVEPEHAKALSMQGLALAGLGRLEEARAYHNRAVAADPDYVMGHVNKAMADLLAGDFETGFREFEWRWRTPAFAAARPDFGRPDFASPRWDGTSIYGKTILLHDEQGFGDAIQFVRYAPLIKDRGGRVIVDCRPELARLFAAMEAVDRVVARGDPRPGFDVHAPLMSLPGIMGTTIGTVPAEVPYLAPPPGVTADLPEPGGKSATKVAIAWGGSPTHGNDRNRSIPLTTFAPLLAREDVAAYGFQVGGRRREIAEAGLAESITDLGDQLVDFAATSAAITQLDLVITADTSLAHLAGALGKPVWVLLPFAPDWRWMTGRDDSPWYPTARLFRQAMRGDWDGVLTDVDEALGQLKL